MISGVFFSRPFPLNQDVIKRLSKQFFVWKFINLAHWCSVYPKSIRYDRNLLKKIYKYQKQHHTPHNLLVTLLRIRPFKIDIQGYLKRDFFFLPETWFYFRFISLAFSMLNAQFEHVFLFVNLVICRKSNCKCQLSWKSIATAFQMDICSSL